MICDRCGHAPSLHREAGSLRTCARCSCRRTQWYLAKMADESREKGCDEVADALANLIEVAQMFRFAETTGLSADHLHESEQAGRAALGRRLRGGAA